MPVSDILIIMICFCINITIYKAIYTTELPINDIKNVNLEGLQKIHQFEIYLKKKKDNPHDMFNILNDHRLHFNICMTPAKNEFKFEVTLDSKIGDKVPEFRFRDEFFVTNSNNDESHIQL